MKKLFFLITFVLLLAACSPPKPKLILVRETVVSEVPVTVEVTRVIEVTREVEVTRVIAVLREIEVTRQVDAVPPEAAEEVPETAVSTLADSFNLMIIGDSLVADWHWVSVFSDSYRDQCNWGLVGGEEGNNVYVPSREGLDGVTIGDFLAEQWHITATENNDPDVILFMLGANDYSNSNTSAAGVAAQLNQMVDEIHAAKEDVEIFIAITPSADEEIAAYAAALQTMADVTYVDLFNEFDVDTMTDDGVQPNDAGSKFIADTYYAALQSAGYCP